MSLLFEDLYAGRVKGMKSSVIRELLKLTQNSDVISFAGGLPASEIFPVAEFKTSTNFVLDTVGEQALQYGPTNGYFPLRQYLANKVEVEPDNILITTGSQQALDLVGKLLIDPGDNIVTEAPTYVGALQAFDSYQPQYLTVPTDSSMPYRLEGILKKYAVKFIYVMPNFQNPSGNTMSLVDRQLLATLAERYGVVIVEDDPYRELRYDGQDLPSLAALSKNVIYLSSFSKTLSPGIRLGWVSASEDFIDKMTQAKQAVDLHTSSFLQMVVHDICKRDVLTEHTELIRKTYKKRRNTMLKAIRDYLPPTASCYKPTGGMFLWAGLPKLKVRTPVLLETALKAGVAFVHGSVFYPYHIDSDNIRLNFSSTTPEHIRVGVERLGKVITRNR